MATAASVTPTGTPAAEPSWGDSAPPEGSIEAVSTARLILEHLAELEVLAPGERDDTHKQRSPQIPPEVP